MTNEEILTTAMKSIIYAGPKEKPGLADHRDEGGCVEDYSGANVDGAFHHGVRVGAWGAAETAREALRRIA